MPATSLTTVPAASQALGEWTAQANATRFLLRAKRDAAGNLLRLTLTSQPDPSTPVTPAAPGAEQQLLEGPAAAAQAAVAVLAEAGDSRIMMRTWLDVSAELEVLAGVAAGDLLVRQFQLTGLLETLAPRAADGKCHLRVFVHATRFHCSGEARWALPVRLVPDATDLPPRPQRATLEIEFAAGQYDTYALEALHLGAAGPGPHHLELLAPEGQTLWRLPLVVDADRPQSQLLEPDGEVDDDGEGGGTDDEDGGAGASGPDGDLSVEDETELA